MDDIHDYLVGEGYEYHKNKLTNVYSKGGLSKPLQYSNYNISNIYIHMNYDNGWTRIVIIESNEKMPGYIRRPVFEGTIISLNDLKLVMLLTATI
jgi:hypothetical protein